MSDASIFRGGKMKARNVIFVIVVLAILGIIVYSQMADQKVCALTGIKAGDYKKSILDNLEMGNEDDAIVSYMEFTSCFGERKSEALQFMVEHYKDLFSDWQQKDMDLEVVSKYKLIKSRVDEPLFERNLEEQVFKSYFNMLSPLEDKIDMLNFVTNTTSAECNRYIPLYEDIKSTIKNTEVSAKNTWMRWLPKTPHCVQLGVIIIALCGESKPTGGA